VGDVGEDGEPFSSSNMSEVKISWFVKYRLVQVDTGGTLMSIYMQSTQAVPIK
jgi:hypothetical protein